MNLKPIERIRVSVLVDNRTDSLSTVPDNFSQEFDNLQGGRMEELRGSCLCCAQHGLSLLVDGFAGGASKTFLFDTGPEGYALERNVDRLCIDLSRTDAVVLSHGHWDHGGGLEKAFELIAKKPIPLYVNQGMFVKRAVEVKGSYEKLAELPTTDQLRAAGADPVISDSSQTFLEDSFYLSGEIERQVPYETGFTGHVCWDEEKNNWQPDPLIMDERYVAIHVEGQGLVVLTACSHAGVINVLRDARKRFPQVPLYGVMGGFHLAGGAMESRIEATVRDLAEFNLRWILPAHCTGWRAVAKLYEAFGDDVVVPLAVGTIFEIGNSPPL